MRIVSLVPSLTLAIARLGHIDDLVAVTDYCTEPANELADIRRIGGTKDPDLDAIAELGADIVVANTDEQRAETLAVLEQLAGTHGFELLVTETDDLEQVADTWTALGAALGADAAASKERERIEAAQAEAAARAAGARPLAALVPVWRSPWIGTGPGTYIASLLETCSFGNVLGHAGEKWPRFVLSTSPEDGGTVEKGPVHGRSVHALAAVPDVVLLPTEPYFFSEPDRDRFMSLGIPRERVRIVDGTLTTWWLTHTADALLMFTGLHEELAHVLTPR